MVCLRVLPGIGLGTGTKRALFSYGIVFHHGIYNPTQSCIDEKMTAADECMKSLRKFVISNKNVRNALKKCNCSRHRTYREKSQRQATFGLNNEEDYPGNFESVPVKGRPETLIEHVTCPKVYHPMLDLKIGLDLTKVAKFIPWKCAKGECENCEIDTKLDFEMPNFIGMQKRSLSLGRRRTSGYKQ